MRNFIYTHIYDFFFFFNCWTSRSSDPYTAVQIGALTSWDIVTHFGALRITLECVTGNLALHHAFENTASTCSQSNSLNRSPQNRAGGTYSPCQFLVSMEVVLDRSSAENRVGWHDGRMLFKTARDCLRKVDSL